MPQTILTTDEIARRTAAHVDALTAAGKFSGAVLLAKAGQPFYSAARGLASRAHNVPNRLDTRFNLGSMNKMFTGVSIAQLVERGCLKFDDPVGRLLPDYPNREVAEKVTVHHLLTHTAGLGSFFNDTFMKTSRELLRKVDDFLPLTYDEKLMFEPGTRWLYSNSGFLLLGAIIEKIAGQSYDDYVREHIYQPAGMEHTDAYELDYDWPDLATGYTEMGAGPGRLKNNLFMHVVKGGPAGGGYSTVEDLLRFDQALRGYRLLGRDATGHLLSPKARLPGSEAWYCYGFGETHVGDERILGHGGGFPGINSNLQMYLKSGYTVAVMTNLDPPAALRVTSRLTYWLTGNDLPVTAPPDPGLLEMAAGSYLLTSVDGMKVKAILEGEGEALVLRSPFMGKQRFALLDDARFINEDTLDTELTLIPGPGGKVEGLTLFGHRVDMKGKRMPS